MEIINYWMIFGLLATSVFLLIFVGIMLTLEKLGYGND